MFPCNKQSIIDAIARGDIKELQRIEQEEIESCRGTIIIVEQNEDSTWNVFVPAFGWVTKNYKILSDLDFKKLIEKYDFQAYDFTHNSLESRCELINGKLP